MKKSAWQCLIPLMLFLAFLPFSQSLDLKISQMCYTPGLTNYDSAGPEKGGHFVENAFTHFIYHYGEWPAFLLCDGAFLLIIISFFVKPLRKWCTHLFTIVLTFVLGAGILVNGILKEHVERARPRQIVELGGKYPFRAAYQPHFVWKQNSIDGQKSFPSGHVTTGAYFFILILIGRRIKNRPILHIGIWMTVIWTPLLMAARIMQGGHFLSDTIAAVLFMWWTALFTDWLMEKFSPFKRKPDFFPERSI